MNETDNVRSVAVGGDEASRGRQATLRLYLEGRGYRVRDYGFDGPCVAGFADAAVAVARAVARGDCERGILLDSLGLGTAIAANKIRGVRAATCQDERAALACREHYNVNVLCLGSAQLGVDDVCLLVRTFLETRFAGAERMIGVNRIHQLERGTTED